MPLGWNIFFFHRSYKEEMDHSEKDIRNMVEQAIRGDFHACRRLIRDHERLVGHIVMRMIQRPSDHEDICQDVFCRVFIHLADFRFECKLSTWIGKIAYNTCLHNLEKRREIQGFDESENKTCVVDGSKSPESAAVAADLASRLRTEMERLHPQDRTILTLFHLDDLGYNDISDILGIPQGSVKSRLFRARQRLKNLLLKTDSDEETWKPDI
jgi:RNA polymerase sigma factor (sigma-70 family)